jgi:hypothetical protein
MGRAPPFIESSVKHQANFFIYPLQGSKEILVTRRTNLLNYTYAYYCGT